MLSSSVILLVGSVFLLNAQDSTQQQTGTLPTFRSEARLVVVDVTVTDDKGDPVTGLSKNDFTLIEDGKEQKILSFEPHVAPPPQAPIPQAQAQAEIASLPPNLYTNGALTTVAGPINVILFDVLNTSPQGAGYARQQMLKFLEQLPPNQNMALFFLGTRLRMLQRPTGKSDDLIAAAKRLLYEKVPLQTSEAEVEQAMHSINNAAALATSRYGLPNPRVVYSMQRAMKDEEGLQRMHRVNYTVAAMKQLAAALSGYPGRKNIIWLTESFPLSTGPDPGASAIQEDPMRHADNFLNAVHELGTVLANQQVAIYPIDVGGMRTRGQDASASVLEIGATFGESAAIQSGTLKNQFASEESTRATMINVADETGGRAFFRTNDLKLAAQKIMAAGSTYYTLTYTPTNADWRGQYRNIKLKTSRPGVKLEYRRGYYAYREPGKTTVQNSRKLLAEAMQPEQVPYTSVLFRAQVAPDPADKSKIVIQYVIDPKTVSFVDTPDGKKSIALDFMAVASTPKERDAGHSSDSLEPAIKLETYNTVLRTGIPASQEVVLKPGKYNLKLGVIDRNTQKIGTVDVPVTIP